MRENLSSSCHLMTASGERIQPKPAGQQRDGGLWLLSNILYFFLRHISDSVLVAVCPGWFQLPNARERKDRRESARFEQAIGQHL